MNSLKLWMLLVKGAGLTIAISSISILIGIAIGAVISAGMLSSKQGFAVPSRIFVSFFRGVPLLVQLLLIYNLLPVIGINVSSIIAAIVGLSLCTAAYQAENLRGGFISVPKGLIEAAEMAGLSAQQQFRRIRLPIAFRLTLPAIINEAIMILKASSLVSVVGVIELTRMTQDLSASTYRPLELFTMAGVVYFIINWCLSSIGSYTEKSIRWGRS